MEFKIDGDIILKEADKGDEALIAEFFDSMGGESRALFNRRDFNRRGVMKFCEKGDKTRRYWLWISEGKMNGYVFFLDYNTSVPSLGIAIRDELRGKGFGMKLITFAQSQAKKEGKGGIILTTHNANIRAQALYEKAGFVCMGSCKNGTELLYLYRYID